MTDTPVAAPVVGGAWLTPLFATPTTWLAFAAAAAAMATVATPFELL